MKATQYMVDESKDDLEYISQNMENGNKKGIEITAHAFKKGFTQDSYMYCKYCGKEQ